MLRRLNRKVSGMWFKIETVLEAMLALALAAAAIYIAMGGALK